MYSSWILVYVASCYKISEIIPISYSQFRAVTQRVFLLVPAAVLWARLCQWFCHRTQYLSRMRRWADEQMNSRLILPLTVATRAACGQSNMRFESDTNSWQTYRAYPWFLVSLHPYRAVVWPWCACAGSHCGLRRIPPGGRCKEE